jgi:hypothetical protein
MRTVAAVFDEMGAALQFPYYFGENWNAFHECITDLSWIPTEAYALIVLHSHAVLADESPAELATFLRILNRAGEEWSRPVAVGEAWDRKGIPFHVVFQVLDGSSVALSERIAEYNLARNANRFSP